MDYLKINGKCLPYPRAFEMKKTPNVVCELETMSGRRVADVNGWRYADTTIEWGALYPDDLALLIAATADHSFEIEFIDESGTVQTVNAVLRSYGSSKTLVQRAGSYVWDGVSITVSFPDCYSYV